VQRGRAAMGAKKQCKNGHEYTPDNVYLRRRSGRSERQCRECSLVRSRLAKSLAVSQGG
jgi:hypothetical protein